MDALDVLKVCFRRWYVMLPILMMALGTGYALAKNQKDSYYAGAAFAFVFQGSDPAQQETRVLNPLADNELLGTALALALADPAMQESLGAPTAAGVAPGETSPDDRRFAFSGSGFTYTVAAWAPTAAAAESTVQNVMDAIPGLVEQIQRAAGAPDGTLSTIFVMSPTRVDVVPASSGLKMLLGVGAVGAIAGAALSIAVDALMTRRARLRRARAAAAAAGADSSAPPAVSEATGSPAASGEGDDGEGDRGDGDHGDGDHGDGGHGEGDDGDDEDDDAPGAHVNDPGGAEGPGPYAEASAGSSRSGRGTRADRQGHRRKVDRRKANRRKADTRPPSGAGRPAQPAALQAPTVQPATVQLVSVQPAQQDRQGDPDGAQEPPPPFESLFR